MRHWQRFRRGGFLRCAFLAFTTLAAFAAFATLAITAIAVARTAFTLAVAAFAFGASHGFSALLRFVRDRGFHRC